MSDLNDLSRLPTPRTAPRWLRYAQTLANLKSEQLARLVLKRVLLRLVPETIPEVTSTPSPRQFRTRRAPFLDDPASLGFLPDSRVLRLLQVEKDLGDPIEWTPAGLPLLWQLELSYFHWMPGDLPWPSARPWIADWLDHAPQGVRTPAWFPFGVAQRALRWTRLIQGPWWDDLQGDPLYARLLGNLYAQCRYLHRHQEKELLGNHLIKTAVALYAGGRFFAGDEADGWLRRAEAILREEIRAQILEDGGHYERSPMYHLLVLVDLADALNLTPPGDRFEGELLRAVERMSQFAADCAHGDEEIPLFNDSVFDQAPTRRDVLRYVERVGGLEPRRSRTGFVPLPKFGLFRLGDARSGLWLDAGETGPPFLQAHAHADTASLELSIGPWRVVCDSGVSSYQDRERRAWDRSTPAHSTVSVSGESSSDCWGSFRVARRARIRDLSWSSDEAVQSVRVRHDGFRHLPGSPRHERSVSFREGIYTILDGVESDRDVGFRCDAFLYLGPDVVVHPRERPSNPPGPGVATVFDLTSDLAPDLDVRVEVRFTGAIEAAEVFLEPAEFSPRFHTRLAGHRIRAACVANRKALGIEWLIAIADRPPRHPGGIG